MTRRCRSCNGTYETEQGRFAYFHACPPEIDDKPTVNPRNENVKQIKEGNTVRTILLSEGKGFSQI